MLSSQTKSLRGFPSDRVVLQSDYPSAQAMCDALMARNDWFTEINVGSATATMAVGNRTVTITSGELYSAGLVRAGDIFSPDDGVTWFNIESVPDDSSIILKSPSKTLTLSGESFLCARPKYVRAYCDSRGHGDNFYFDADPTKAIFVQLINNTGFVQTRVVTGSSVPNIQIPPQGVLCINGFKSTQLVPETGHVYLATSVFGVGPSEAPVHFEEHNGIHKFSSVDVFYPTPHIGSVSLNASYYESIQDLLLLNANGGFVMNRVTVVGNAKEILPGVTPSIRVFQRIPDIMTDCDFELRHVESSPASAISVVFPTNESFNNGRSSTMNGGSFKLISPVASNMCPIGKFSGDVSANVNMTMNGVIFDDSGIASGTPLIVDAETYTGGGSLTMNGCDKGGMSDGGGGTFSITTNP